MLAISGFGRFAFLRFVKHQGVSIGATLVLHTWSSALTHHPKVHGTVQGGGLAPDGKRWIAWRPGFFLSVRVLSRQFRRRSQEELLQVHQAGKLQFFDEHAALADAKAFGAWLAPLRQCEWVVSAKRPFAGPQAVLACLSRYTHRVAISNSRLIAMDEHGVTFKWRVQPMDAKPAGSWHLAKILHPPADVTGILFGAAFAIGIATRVRRLHHQSS